MRQELQPEEKGILGLALHLGVLVYAQQARVKAVDDVTQLGVEAGEVTCIWSSAFAGVLDAQEWLEPADADLDGHEVAR
jgi:hypothetical protein